MRRDQNRITLIGALTDHPTITETRDGLPRALLTIAGQQQTLTADGQPRTLNWRHLISLIGAATTPVTRLQPGAIIQAHGALRSRTINQEGGPSRHKVEVHAHEAHPTQHAHPAHIDVNGRHYLQHATNHVTLTGNLARDMQTRRTRHDLTLAKSALICHEPDPNNPGHTRTQYVPIVLWGALAEALADATQGNKLHLQGIYLTHKAINAHNEIILRTVVEGTSARLL